MHARSPVNRNSEYGKVSYREAGLFLVSHYPRISFIFMYIFAIRILDHHIDFDNITYFGALLGIVLTFIVIIIVYLNKYKLGLNLLGESKLFKVPYIVKLQ